MYLWYNGNSPRNNLPCNNLSCDNLQFFKKHQLVVRQIAVLSYLSRDKIGVFYNIGPYT
jgi:hypothetical protein